VQSGQALQAVHYQVLLRTLVAVEEDAWNRQTQQDGFHEPRRLWKAPDEVSLEFGSKNVASVKANDKAIDGVIGAKCIYLIDDIVFRETFVSRAVFYDGYGMKSLHLHLIGPDR
jgi:hypothetical protein